MSPHLYKRSSEAPAKSYRGAGSSHVMVLYMTQNQTHICSLSLFKQAISGLRIVVVAQLRMTFVTPGTMAHQAPLSMTLSSQEYWNGLHFLLQRIFLTQGLNSGLLQDSLLLSHQASSGE